MHRRSPHIDRGDVVIDEQHVLHFVGGVHVAQGRGEHPTGEGVDLVAPGQPHAAARHPHRIGREQRDEIVGAAVALRRFNRGNKAVDGLDIGSPLGIHLGFLPSGV